ELDQLAKPEKCREIRNACRLLHVVSHDDDRVFLAKVRNQLFNLLSRDRIKRRRGLVHQHDLGFNRQRARDANSLLLTARQPQGGIFQSVLYFIPYRRGAKARFDSIRKLAFRMRQRIYSKAISDVIKDRPRKGIRLLKHHADPPPKRDDIHSRRVDILTVDFYAALHPSGRNHVVHSVQRAQQSRFAATRRPDERSDLVRRNRKRDIVKRARSAVVEIELLDFDLCRGLLRPLGGVLESSLLNTRHTCNRLFSSADIPLCDVLSSKAHHASRSRSMFETNSRTRAPISSRTRRNTISRSSSAPVASAGSSKLQ